MVEVEEEGAAEACWAGKASTGAAPAGRVRRKAAEPPWRRPPGSAVVAAALVAASSCVLVKWNAEILGMYRRKVGEAGGFAWQGFGVGVPSQDRP
jgi:ferric-dicitrate binding protein FerR (iron transport regulator)